MVKSSQNFLNIYICVIRLVSHARMRLWQVYKKFSRELCVVVTNVSEGSSEYCHYKTTPDLPVIDAVRMTLATPGRGFPHIVSAVPIKDI